MRPCSDRQGDAMTCDHGELVAAARALLLYLNLSTEVQSNDLLYRSPAQGMRDAADAIERKDSAIRRFREALAACEGEQQQPACCCWVHAHGRCLECPVHGMPPAKATGKE